MRRIALVSNLLAACTGGDAPDAPSATEADSLTVAAAIGGIDDTRPEYEFARIGGVVALEDGRVVVVDATNDVIRVYNADGAHQFSFGRNGAGPGEVSAPCCLAVDREERLWVRDGGNARYNVYELHADSATFVRQVRMAHGDENYWASVTFDAAGHVIDVGHRSDAQSNSRLYRFHLDSAGTTARETALHSVPQDSTAMKSVSREIEGGSMTLYAHQPYGPQPLYAYAPNGEFAHALNSRYAIDWRNEDGSLLRHITHELAIGPTLSSRERTVADSQMVQQARRLSITTAQLGFDVPASKPPLRAIFFDLDGRLWVELNVPDGTSRTAHIYERDGTLARTVVWPRDVNLSGGSIRGDAAWGIRTDSLDVVTLVRLTGLHSRN